MNSVNLIPAGRLKQRRGMARLRAWLIVGPISIGLLLLAYVVNLATWETDAGPVSRALHETKEQVAAAQVQIAQLKKELREEQAVLRANRSVGEQPDWGSLLSLLSSCLGRDAALVTCTVEPVIPESSTKPGKEPVKAQIRPQRLRLLVHGLSRTQEAASRFVIELEGTKLFEKVVLVEAKRDATRTEDVSFDVACELTDSGAVTK